MWRAVLETLALFSLPFVFYVILQALLLRWPFVAELWSRGVVSTLAIAGLLVAVFGFLALGFSTRQQGAYVPAHIENGRVAPGRFE
jgi:hypothetical protein